ncbi:hypothetical protein [Herbidospora mongoliensis]|uniref:hypothetical protein n=1 Tax=Herbidospora mongoliensis TaxID=688067 RepID=UPI000B2C2C94|nr:hypothetical protein [Herbidospora mongoliensis]
MKHRRLAAAGLLALAVTFGATGAANATDDVVPTLTSVADTISCTAVDGENVQIKDGVITVDGKEVAAVKVTKAIPALPGEPGVPAAPHPAGGPVLVGGEGLAVAAAAPLPPGEPGKLAETVTIVAAVPGEPSGPIELGEVKAVPALPMPQGEAGTTMAKPTSPDEGPSFSIGGEAGQASPGEGAPHAIEGAKVVCVSAKAPKSPEAPESPAAPAE